ncbi:DUF302 domain-containing protein [Litoreibacter roseus]|uniref:DUF302 domain-containing protein n=1 Tax=Litoreibacter roseus TaxID=2601869 RepID=A0A6N6JCN0_9RHOB|nr:DUF302 domain-containing protein [Litoreibacter roseus]GFE63916.1 hypothetical protein KIN_09900 [Litoreibacter roseus]
MRLVVIRWLSFLCFASFAFIATASDMEPREGWMVLPTDKPYERLIDDLKIAVKANKMGVVTQAGPTQAAASRGITIPGNRIIGVFNNQFAVEVLGMSTAAMIEAPIRFYVTENIDGTATLSYKTPSYIFTPYVAEAGVGLSNTARKLDDIFQTIAEAAVR